MKTTFRSRLKYSSFLILITVLIIVSGCGKDEGIPTFTDSRDGQTYEIVTIGNQTWMAENLNYNSRSFESWCLFDDPQYCFIYGRLYKWNTAVTVAPNGWHLPSDTEWQELIQFLGGNDVAGGKLKEAGITHWLGPDSGADNSSGFTALPGGGCNPATSSCFDDLTNGLWWSSTSKNSSQAWCRVLDCGDSEVERSAAEKGLALSVRCVKD